jgi:hypothetical protein
MRTVATFLLAQEVFWDRRHPWFMGALGVVLVAISVWYALRWKRRNHEPPDEEVGPPS